MAQIIDKIIRQSQAPNSTNVMWDNGEQLFINRNGSWQSVGGSSNGGSDVVVKVVDFDLLLDNPEYAKEIYAFVKTSYMNNIIIMCVMSESGVVVPTFYNGAITTLVLYYDAEVDLVVTIFLSESPFGYTFMIGMFGPSTEYNIIPIDIFDTGDGIVVGIFDVSLSTVAGAENNNFFTTFLLKSDLFSDMNCYSPEYNCKLYLNTYPNLEHLTYSGLTEDNKILKIEVETDTGKTISSTLFDLNSLITTT